MDSLHARHQSKFCDENHFEDVRKRLQSSRSESEQAEKMIRMARVYDVPDEMFREKQRILEYFLGVQLQEGDVLYSKMYGARLWPAIFSDWNILTVPLQITRKHKDALRFFCLVTLQLEKRSMCTFLTLRNDDDGIVDCFGSIDSRVESVIYKTMVHFYRNKLEIRVNKIFE